MGDFVRSVSVRLFSSEVGCGFDCVHIRIENVKNAFVISTGVRHERSGEIFSHRTTPRPTFWHLAREDFSTPLVPRSGRNDRAFLVFPNVGPQTASSFTNKKGGQLSLPALITSTRLTS